MAAVLEEFGYATQIADAQTDMPPRGLRREVFDQASVLVCDIVNVDEDLPVEVALAGGYGIPVIALVPAGVPITGLGREVLAACTCEIVRCAAQRSILRTGSSSSRCPCATPTARSPGTMHDRRSSHASTKVSPSPRSGMTADMEDRPDRQDMAPGDEAPPEAAGAGENLCPDCSGSGRKENEECPTCAGTGRVMQGIGGA